VFDGDFNGPIHRFSDVPAALGQPQLAAADSQLVMHIDSLTDRFGIHWMVNCANP
jgi:hypothetical protein